MFSCNYYVSRMALNKQFLILFIESCKWLLLKAAHLLHAKLYQNNKVNKVRDTCKRQFFILFFQKVLVT